MWHRVTGRGMPRPSMVVPAKLAQSTPPAGERTSFLGVMENKVMNVWHALDPQSTFIKSWRQVLLVAVVYDLALFPFELTFKPDQALHATTEGLVFYAVESIFCLDFMVNFNTGYYENGAVHRDLHHARIKYLCSREFALDAIAILPLSLLPVSLDGISNMWLETHKLLRLWRIPAYLSNLDDVYAKYFAALKIVKMIIGTLLLSHYLACLRFSFGYDVFARDLWLPPVPTEPHSVRRQYLMSLFWSFGMLTGLYEGELPFSIGEFIFTIAVGLCGFAIFTYLCVMFFMLSKCESGQTEAAEARINQLKHVLAFHRVPDHLQYQAIEYLQRYCTDAESNDREAIKLVCPSIAKDIQVELMRDTVAKIPVFLGCSAEFIVALTSALEMMSLPTRCTLFNAGDEGDGMYIIHSGVLDVVVGKATVRELRKGDFVGELSLFSNRPRSATVVTTTYCILYQLSRFHTEKVLEGYPEFVPIIKKSVFKIFAKTTQNRADSHLDTSVNPSGTNDISFCSPRLQSYDNKLVKEVSQRNLVVPFNDNEVPRIPSIKRAKEGQGQVGFPAHRRSIGKMKRLLTTRRFKGSETVKVFHDQYTRQVPDEGEKTFFSRFLLRRCIDADSKMRLWWVVILQMILLYNWLTIPMFLVFSAVETDMWTLAILDTISDLILWADIYGNFNLSFTLSAEKIFDPTRSARRYFKGDFKWDVLLVLPYVVLDFSTEYCAFSRIPRLFRVWRLKRHLEEIDKLFHLTSKRKLMLFGALLLVLSHVVACLHFSTTIWEGFSEQVDSWIPTNDIELRKREDGSFADVNNVTHTPDSAFVHKIAKQQYFRSLYYATNVLTGLGRTIEPNTDTQYTIALIFMFSGFLITATIVDNVQKRFTAPAYEQKEFFAVRLRIQLFLRRQDAPLAIHHRVNSFLDYWWASHRGAIVENLLVDLPVAYRREILRSICKPVLQTLSLLNGVRSVLDDFETVFVDRGRFVLYGQGEYIFRNGDNARNIYFLLTGTVTLFAEGVNHHVPEGGFFGTQALHVGTLMTGYVEDAVAASGCILIEISRDAVDALLQVFPDLEMALDNLAHRLSDNKLARFSSDAQPESAESESLLQRVFFSALDPDSLGSVAWETWLFIVMSIQWIIIMYHIAFGVSQKDFLQSDIVTVALEISFVVDIQKRLRLGFHEFGNKIMDLKRIRRRYFRSPDFFVDMVALLPLFALNWVIPGTRYEIWNLNKLMRVLKVPGQLQQLEQRYLKRTIELRVFKLVYYAFLLTHVFGCIYFDMAAHLSMANLSDPALDLRAVSFGKSKWLLPLSYQDASSSYQYTSSLFVVYGLMSASYQGELPKTTGQCIASVGMITAGFFLFAYVVGNFADIIEMVDAEDREFNSKLGSIRHLLGHFRLSDEISTKLRAYFCFRRVHTITQEQTLELCLPPSLVTDIRLLILHPMIRKVPFLGGMEESITRMLVAQFRQALVLKGEYVYQHGDEGSDMYFVYTGMLSVLAGAHPKKPDGRRQSRSIDAKIHLSELVSGDFFGENALFTDSPRNAYVLAKTSCILYELSRQSLEMLFELFPTWKKQVLQTVKVQQKRQRAFVGRTPERLDDKDVVSKVIESDSEGVGDEDSVVDLPHDIPRNLQSLLLRASPESGWRRRIPRWMMQLINGMPAQSRTHIHWLQFITMCTTHIAFVVPYSITLGRPQQQSDLALFAQVIGYCCDAMFVLDVWVNWNLQESELSIEFYEQNLRQSYKRDRMFWDICALLPLEVLAPIHPNSRAWFRINRCIKMANIVHYLNELHRQHTSNEWARFKTISFLCLIGMFWTGSVYLAINMTTGYSSNWYSWAPSEEINLGNLGSSSTQQVFKRFLRGFFFAVTAFVKKCRTFFPERTGHAVFTILASFGGVLIMAFMIGEIASLYISYIENEVDFRKNHISVELYLARYKLKRALRDRAHVYLSTIWSMHSGVNYDHILADLPKNMRVATVLHIADAPLKAFMEVVIRPLMRSDTNGCKSVLHSLVEELKFEAYSRGEYVIAEGVISGSMYFVVRGKLFSHSKSMPSQFPIVRYSKGHYFGDRGLIALSVSRVSVRTLKACDLFSLTSESLIRVLKSQGYLNIVMKAAHEVVAELRATSAPGTLPKDVNAWKGMLHTVLDRQRRTEGGTALRHRANTETAHSRGFMQWNALVTDVLNADKRDGGLSKFEGMFELLAPNGRTFDPPNDTKRQSMRVPVVVRSAPKGRLRGFVTKIVTSDPRASSMTTASRTSHVTPNSMRM